MSPDQHQGPCEADTLTLTRHSIACLHLRKASGTGAASSVSRLAGGPGACSHSGTPGKLAAMRPIMRQPGPSCLSCHCCNLVLVWRWPTGQSLGDSAAATGQQAPPQAPSSPLRRQSLAAWASPPPPFIAPVAHLACTSTGLGVPAPYHHLSPSSDPSLHHPSFTSSFSIQHRQPPV